METADGASCEAAASLTYVRPFGLGCKRYVKGQWPKAQRGGKHPWTTARPRNRVLKGLDPTRIDPNTLGII